MLTPTPQSKLDGRIVHNTSELDHELQDLLPALSLIVASAVVLTDRDAGPSVGEEFKGNLRFAAGRWLGEQGPIDPKLRAPLRTAVASLLGSIDQLASFVADRDLGDLLK